MKRNKTFRVVLFACFCLIFTASCVKEGPQGPMGLTGAAGANGKDGINGKDANETCKLCHNQSIVEQKAVEYQFSKHEYGEAAFEEAGNTGCTPCHAQEAFKYVCKNNVSAVFVKNATTGKYSNPYATLAANSLGEFGCTTCHANLHTTYGYTDFYPLTTTAPVQMTMWGGAKTINLTVDNSKSNLCIKCHQPRPFVTSTSTSDGNVLDYAGLAAKPKDIFFDPALTTNKITPGYRTHTHYGTVGAIYAGMGGVEFSGTLGYVNMIHTSKASCQDCHMATLNGRNGGHTFVAKGNFNGCNTTSCHGANAITASNTKYWTNPRAEIKKLLEDLAAKLKVNGVEILNKNPNTNEDLGGVNLWAGLTAGNYDGYLNIYDPINNANGIANNGNCFQAPSVSSSWTQAQKDLNATLPKITLTNAQMGAIINFQLCLREYSLGIHNFNYSKALLTNSIAVLN
jgi:hypothetical protein